jgi:hypothetical protein
VVSLTSATWPELVLYLKTLLATKSYGAETRTKGDMRNAVLGIVAGYEEVITSLEYSLELAAVWEEANLGAETERILRKYTDLSASRGNLVVMNTDEVNQLISHIQDMDIDKDLVEFMDKQAKDFVKKAKS